MPDRLDPSAFQHLYFKQWVKSHPHGQKLNGPKRQEQDQERLNGLQKFTKGISFAFEQLPREADAHYAGKGVSLGAADKPIFWYRPKDSKKYRVIYADLSVREADTAPNVPDAQSLLNVSGSRQ